MPLGDLLEWDARFRGELPESGVIHDWKHRSILGATVLCDG
jgi:hypothetical protein